MRNPPLKPILTANVIIFSVVAILHLGRVLAGWEITVSNWVAPQILSVLLFLIAGYLAYANNLHRK